MKRLSSDGFTIIELLIATAVLSTLLLIVTLILTNIGILYSKGVYTSRLQDDTRQIASQLTQDLQLSSGETPGTPTGSTLAFCVGTVRYSYIIGKQIASSGVPHVLWRDAAPSPCVAADLSLATPSAGGIELIASKSRLAYFDVQQDPTSQGLYRVSIATAYGDDDLLCSPAVGNCSNGTVLVTSDYPLLDIQCKGSTGHQFCDTTKLSTTVVQRLASN